MTESPFAISEAIRAAYDRGQDDETMEPIVLCDRNGEPVGRIRDRDYVIFYDIRGEREIELTQSFVDPEFSHFPIDEDLRTRWVTMIEYDPGLAARAAFSPLGQIRNTLAEVVTGSGRRVCKISESEKAIHVGFFMNGKVPDPFPGETRVAVESHRTDHMDRFPAMKAVEVADATIEKLRGDDELMITNFANIDVLGHIENEAAILQAVRTVDQQVGRVLSEAKAAGVPVMITSDHGTVEKWLYPEGAVDTGHTDTPVHFLYVHNGRATLREGGSLVDVAPTVLHALGLSPPAEMTGVSLIQDLSPGPRLLLLITDGWGYNRDSYGNLIRKAGTPVMDRLRSECGWTLLKASGEAVGLPEGTVGNSEAGHMHIGSGRVIPSDRVRIQRAIDDGSFYENEAFLWAMRGALTDRTRLHLLGIISFFSSHGSISYLKHLLRMARDKTTVPVYIHGLLGRRGERPESGARYTREVEEESHRLEIGRFVSIIGRHWALDREYNWDRIEKTYRWLVHGDGVRVSMPE